LNPNEFIILEHYVSREFSRKLKSYSLTFEDFTAEIPRLAKVAITAPYIVYSIFKNLRDHDPTFKNYNLFNDIRYEIFKLAAKNILSDELITKIHDEYFPVIRDAFYNREEVIARFIRDMMYYVDTGKVVERKFENTDESNYYNKDYKFEDCDESKIFKLINYVQLIKVYVFYIMLIPGTCYGNIYV
jgi:beta-xylosidase